MVDKTLQETRSGADRSHVRFEAFLKANEIKPAHLARDSGVSRKHIFSLRMGRSEPTKHIMIALATSAQRILRRKVEVGELFDLDNAVPPVVEMVAHVTPEHGYVFADTFLSIARDTEAPIEAIARSGIMRWPETAAGRLQHERIADEIIERALDAARRLIAEAFVIEARAVLDRERQRRP